jgi:Tn3 transposase DDE domain
VVSVRTLHAGHNSKYFHVERGVTYYNFTSNQFSGFHGIVIPGTLHDFALRPGWFTRTPDRIATSATHNGQFGRKYLSQAL